MKLLGLLPFGYNPSACLMKDEKIVCFAEEERLLRIKGAVNYFPVNAIKFCLKYGKINFEDIDAIVVGWDCNEYVTKVKKVYQNLKDQYGPIGKETLSWQQNNINFYNPESFKKYIITNLKKANFFGKIPKIEFINHHLAHASQAYYSSGLDNAAILIIDGSGEYESITLWKGEKDTIKKITSWNIPESLGWFYSSITQFLGFRHNFDEAKVMGLAAYGKHKQEYAKQMQKIMSFNKSMKVNPFYTYWGHHYQGKGFSKNLIKLFGQPRLKDDKITNHHRYIAFALQEQLENIAIDLAKIAMEKSGSKNICLSGGVSMNCKMNGEIIRKVKPDKYFIHPASGDSGSAIGACLAYFYKRKKRRPKYKLNNAYFGPEFTNDEIETILKRNKLTFKKSKKAPAIAADYLKKGKVIGWFQGRMEGGARALGHRSILANPSIRDMKDRINGQIKFREMWRPFCPSILHEYQKDWLEFGFDAPYMILAMMANPDKKHKIPSVVHIDGSVRPQSVKKNREGKYWEMMQHFYNETGVPLVLNTSFNIKGEPIVHTPIDALKCFYGTGMDALVINDFILEK